MDSNYNTHVHISSNLMEIMPSSEKSLPYISKKNVVNLLNLNGQFEIDGEVVLCSQLASLFALNSIDCYRSNKKMKISKLFSDEESIKMSVPNNFKEIHKNIIENSCDRHIIACGRFGNFLYKIASATALGEQRFFILHSGNHVMSFKVMHKTKEIEGVSLSRWVVHFFDPNKTNVISRSEVLNLEEFLDLGRFALRMFMTEGAYRNYFEDVKSGSIENECVIYECSDTRESNLDFSTLETLSQDGISGCMIHHMMCNSIGPLDIIRVVKSSSFSTLSADIRREIFIAKSSLGISALHVAMGENNPSAIIAYNIFLEELSYDEQVNLLPDIIKTESSEGVPALFVAMQYGYVKCIDVFGLLIDRLINVRHRIVNFTELIFDILLAKRRDGLSALSMSLLINEVDSVLAFGNLLDSIFVLKEDVVDSRILSNMIFMLLNSEDNRGINSLFYAFQGGHVDTVFAFGALIDRLLLMKGHVSDNYMASMIFRLLSCENDNGFPGLFYAFQGGHADTVRAFGTLMDRLLVMKGYVSDNYMASMIFRLLSCENNNGLPGLFYAFQEGHAYTVRAFGALIDRLFIMRGYIEDVVLLDMVFSLLICKSGDNGVPGLFVAMQNGHHSTVDAFRELLEKTVIFKNDTSSEYFNNIILDIIISRRSDGVYGLSVALKNNFSEVVKCYGLLLNLIPKYELVNVLVASDNCDIPAALFAGKEALDSYLMIISSLPTSAIYALYSRLSSIRMSIIHTPLSNSDLDGRYKALLKKVKKLAIRSVPNIVIT